MKKTNSIESLKEEGLITTAENYFYERNKKFEANKGRSCEEIEKYKRQLLDVPIIYSDSRTWIKQIEDYCSTVGILPEDLILAHKSLNKPIKSKKSTNTLPAEESANLPIPKPSKFNSNWSQDYKKLKTGI